MQRNPPPQVLTAVIDSGLWARREYVRFSAFFRYANRSIGPITQASSKEGNRLKTMLRALLWRTEVVVFSVVLLSTLRTAHAQTSESVLYNFCSQTNCVDGEMPSSSLTFDPLGNLYGTTFFGGANGQGAVFELSPLSASGCASGSNLGNGWCETVLYSFCSLANCTDGKFPFLANVILDQAGNLYGTTQDGGTSVGNSFCASSGCGTVFELSPAILGGCPDGSNPGNGWCETVLHNFCIQTNCPDGWNPTNGLVQDALGNLYGVTFGAPFGGGTVFELSPNSGGPWNETVIYDIATFSEAGLAVDAGGNLYGADDNQSGQAFKLSQSNGVWTPIVTGMPKNAYTPLGTPFVDNQGNVYGTTFAGGNRGFGTVWEMSPVETIKNTLRYKKRVLHWFTAQQGTNPSGGVVLDAAGNVYGTTGEGGPNESHGTVFELVAGTPFYKYKLLWSFDGLDGSGPVDSPVLDNWGNLYGTSYTGGSSTGNANCPSGCGTVFEVTP
jgi:uncharacterized repeat protein (TIGR03803 family)